MLDRTEQKTILGESFDKYLIPDGYKRTNDLKWIKGINNDFSSFLSLELLKGDTYVPTWGISLKFGHKVNRENLKDLIYDPVDYFKPFTEWTLPMSTYNWKDLDTFSRGAKELSEKSCK